MKRALRRVATTLLALAAIASLAWFVAVRGARGRSGGTALAAASTTTSTRVRAEGRVVAHPDADVVVGAEIGGALVSLPIHEKSPVKKGDLIAELASAEQRAAAVEARAHARAVEVDVRHFEAELAREERLLSSGSGTRFAADRARYERDRARAQRDVAAAVAARLDAALAKTRIVSPIDGVVVARFVQPGETLAPGARVASIVDLSRTRVEVDVDEFDAARVVVGADATIAAEGYAGRAWRGRVDEIPDAVSARRLRPSDPGRPTDTRVLDVKIALAEATPLRLGQRVEVEIAAAGPR